MIYPLQYLFTMKTHSIITSLFVILSITFIACQDRECFVNSCDEKKTNIELSLEELASISFSDSTILNTQEVIDILKKHLCDLDPSSDNLNINISNISNEYLEETNSCIYKLNFYIDETLNTAIISGDKRFPYVLATFEMNKGEDLANNLDSISPLKYSKELFQKNIQVIQHIQDSLYHHTMNKISKSLDINSQDISVNNLNQYIKIKDIQSRSTIVTNPPEDAIAGNGPFIKVSWNCGMPYNQLMPQNCPDNWLWDNRYPISSVVVATAHLLSFFRPTLTIDGTYIDWTYLCEKEEIHDTSDYFGSYSKDPDDKCLMIAKLMKYIGEQCSVSYSCNSSSVYPQKVIDFLNRYNISIDKAQSMDVTKLKASIDNLNPVLMYGQDNNGGGHWWIVDGYRTQVASRGTFFPGYNVYIHANMGMGKSYTGYYLVSSDGSLTFDTTFAHFNKNLKMYTNIHN